MALGSPELRLNVSFDIDHFKRVALQGLADAASQQKPLDIGVQFNRDDITSEMVSLGRQLGRRKYRVDFEIRNIQTALDHVGKLSAALDALNKKTSAVKAPSQSSVAAAPSGGGTIAKSRFDSPVISTGEVAAIYKAAADASLLEFNKAIVGNKRAMATELSTVAKESIAGLVNALAAGKGQVGDAFANLGAEGLKRIKDRLGIESPSKEMEQIGIWAGKGYQLGFVKSLEEANLAAAAVIGKSLRRMDGIVSARQRASRMFAPGENINPKKISDLESKLQSLRNSYKAIVDESKKSGPISYEKLQELNEQFKRINSQIVRTESLLGKLRTAKPNVPFLRTQQRLGTALGQREQLQTAAQIPQLRAAAGTYTEGSLQNINKLLQSAQLLAAGLVPRTEEWGQAQSEIARLNHELRISGELANKIQLQHDFGQATKGSIAYLETKLQLLKNIAKDIVPNEGEWNKINKKIQNTERSLEKLTRKPLSAKDRMGAAGGAFLYGGGMGGGAGSAGLGIAGGLIGGVPGAFAGAAVGQVADNALAGAAAMAKQYSQLQKMQRGLAIASIDAKDFAEAQGLVASVSTRLLLPLADASKYYAQLRINTKQYNISAKDTSEILEGTVNAVRATGGSLEDVDGAMRAVVQIFSKGGVQAEELRGQLGERFPGAVIKFAQANKITFEELQKRLEAGTVGIAEFVAFSKSNFTDYAEFSKQLATAPEYAGDRLKIALEKLQLVIGGIFAPMGAHVQDFTTNAIKDITQLVTENKSWLTQMGKDFAVVFSGILSVVSEAATLMFRILAPVFSRIADIIRQLKVMTGSANAATAKVEMNTAWKALTENKAKKDAYMRGEFKLNGEDTLSGALEYDRASARYQRAEKQFKSAGGNAALAKENTTPTLVFGGAGANMPLTRDPKDEAAKGAESFAKLQDDLAKTYNDAEIARIKQRHELEKQLRQDYFTMQEYGANRLQKQNLSLLRDLAAADQKRKDTIIEAKMELQKQSGRVAGGADGGGGMAGLTKYITGDPSQKGKGYQADHGGTNYHDHLQFATREAAVAAYDKLTRNGIKVTEFKGFGAGVTGPHGGPGSAHHTGMAFDVGGAQRPVGQEPELSKQVRALIMGGQVSAGSRRVVRGSEQRDVLAQANTGIARRSAKESALAAQEVYASDINIAFAKYAAEVFDTANLELSTQLLAKRNTLIAQGLSPENIDYQMKLYEVGLLNADMERRWDEAKKAGKLSDDEKAAGLKDLADRTKAFTDAQKANNDEVLDGLRIGKLTALDDQLAMAKAFTPDEERRVRIKQENTGQTVEFQNQLFDREKTVEAAQKLKEQLTGIASSIGDAFSSSFKGIIDGSMTAQQALAGFFQNLSNYFADMVSKMIAEYLKMQLIKGLTSLLPGLGGMFGGGGGLSDLNAPGNINNPLGYANGGLVSGGFRAFATGGIVTGPTLGLVGEGRYNEAVIPLPDGKSVPVDLGGMSGGMASAPITVNVSVDAKGSEVQGDSAQGAALGRVIAASVQSELIKQKRPGGLLAK